MKKYELKETFLSFVLLLLVSILAVLCLELWKTQPQGTWQADSEALVWGRISDAQKGGFFTKGGLLRQCETDEIKGTWKQYAQNELSEVITFVYPRQSGLQGTIDAALAIFLQTLGVSNESIQNTIWKLNSVALVFLVFLMCWWLYKELGGQPLLEGEVAFSFLFG